ncbi:hypothetical protein KKC08_02955 [Patescibacteria group bacterium]|nr:hypothetical protein [Patescibacteria group bacterium]MBU4265011.1 hypothetical protein [Patescibacteria group bacterium]MBU4397097.1 hypothetical protein [Patescibacteria group bacterium]MBU4431567.1 hypothetical protein [Patescibacteria group bacterium]MBU4579322.1 hypothetical protein [Patescibacteria group bacterium]
MRVEGSYFDIGAYVDGGGGVDRRRMGEDLTALMAENRAGVGLEERITPFEIRFGKDGMPNFELRWKTKADFAENEALSGMRDLAKEGWKHMLWISPPSGEIGYKESRFVVAVVRSVGEEVVLECRGICGEQSTDECVKIARNLGLEVSRAEELRNRPIPFVVGKGNWVDVLGRVIDMPEVWRTVKERGDVRDQASKRGLAEMVVGRMEARLAGMRTDDCYERLKVGAEMERMLQQLGGVRLQSRGSCGMSNTEALSRLSSGGSFDMVFAIGLGGGEFSRSVDRTFDCPKCGGAIASGRGITVCPHCGTRKEDCGSVCD